MAGEAFRAGVDTATGTTGYRRVPWLRGRVRIGTRMHAREAGSATRGNADGRLLPRVDTHAARAAVGRDVDFVRGAVVVG